MRVQKYSIILFFKQGKRLYFSRRELLEWIKAGKKKTFKELQEKEEGYFRTSWKRK